MKTACAPVRHQASRTIRVGFALFWLRESSGGTLRGDYGRSVRSGLRCRAALSVSSYGAGAAVSVKATAVVLGKGQSRTLRSIPEVRPEVAAEIERRVADAVETKLRVDAAAAWTSDAARAPLSLPEEITIELHFPFHDRLNPIDSSALTASVDEVGRIVLGQRSAPLGEVLAAGALLRRKRPGAPATLLFTHRAHLTGGDLLLHVGPFLRAHGLTAALHDLAGAIEETGLASRANRFEVTFLLRLTGCGVAPWLDLPSSGRGSQGFYDVMKHAVYAAQKALRLWSNYDYFVDDARYRNRDSAWPVLVYSTMRPVEGRRVWEYTVDTLDPRRLIRSLRWTSRPLREYLKPAKQRLLDADPTMRNITTLLPTRGRDRIVKAMRSLPRPFALLVNGESKAVEAILAHGDTVAKARGDVRYLRRTGLHFHETVLARLNRMAVGHSFRHLAGLLHVAVTWGLAWAVGREARLELIGRIREVGSETEFWVGRPISYENSWRRKALK